MADAISRLAGTAGGARRRIARLRGGMPLGLADPRTTIGDLESDAFLL